MDGDLNGYTNYYQSTEYRQGQGGTNKSPKKKSGAGKKIFIGALVGIVFGIFAGLGFQAVSAAGSFLKSNVPAIEKISDNIENEIAKEENSTGSGIKFNESKVEDDTAQGALSDTASQDEKNTSAEKNIITTTVTDVTEVVKATMPSLVSVNNKFTQKFNYFGQTYYQDSEGAGSGIIIGENDTELLLVTNYHVVEDANELTVTFVDNSEATAYIKGVDEDRDLAVISVNLEDLSQSTKNAITIATLGDSDALTVGEPVVAIGNSLGYGQSVTAGVVSALDRAIAASDYEDDYGYGGNGYGEHDYSYSSGDKEVATFIQTDAAINPGNSGGALLNMKGEVIGINSNKIGGSVVEGMGYAIPISSAKPIIEDIMTRQTRVKASEANKGYLGITGVDVSAENSEIYGMPMGVFVSSVSHGTGADEAGLIRGDIIVGLNGTEIRSMDDLKGELAYYSAGDTVELTIMQGSPTGYQSKTVEVTLSAAVQ